MQYAGANDNGDRPTHIMGAPDSVWHAGMRVAWVRWQCFHDDGEITYGRWEPVLPGKPYIDPRPGRLG